MDGGIVPLKKSDSKDDFAMTPDGNSRNFAAFTLAHHSKGSEGEGPSKK